MARMNETEARAVVAEAMAAASVHGAWDERLEASFRRGEADLPLEALELDSLNVMELCIAIEAHAGVELVPERVHRAGTLEGLVRLVRGGRA